METILQIIVFLYAITGIVVTIGYFPTIKDLMRKEVLELKLSRFFSFLTFT